MITASPQNDTLSAGPVGSPRPTKGRLRREAADARDRVIGGRYR